MKKGLAQEVETEESEADGTKEANASPIARAVARLKEVSFNAARERERLPQPLFWSVFGHELQRIKKEKKALRLLAELFEDEST